MNRTAKILAGVAALIAAGVAVGAAMAPLQETVTVIDGGGGPCGEGIPS